MEGAPARAQKVEMAWGLGLFDLDRAARAVEGDVVAQHPAAQEGMAEGDTDRILRLRARRADTRQHGIGPVAVDRAPFAARGLLRRHGTPYPFAEIMQVLVGICYTITIVYHPEGLCKLR